MDEFEWGPIEGDMKRIITSEFFSNDVNIYERFNKVKTGDIVVDLGASIGPFAYSIRNKNIDKIYCVEPSIYEINTLLKNTESLKRIIYPFAIGDSDDKIKTEVYGSENKFEIVKSKRFKTFIKENDISKIDFLKTDCEGGEYEVFNIENLCWLKENMKYCSGEWHLQTILQKQKFREFRDVFLRVFPKHEIYSVDGTNIKWDLWNEHFIEYYNQVIIYIDNK